MIKKVNGKGLLIAIGCQHLFYKILYILLILSKKNAFDNGLPLSVC
jgi:hypothetical protein